jgi:hypothetical protein
MRWHALAEDPLMLGATIALMLAAACFGVVAARTFCRSESRRKGGGARFHRAKAEESDMSDDSLFGSSSEDEDGGTEDPEGGRPGANGGGKGAVSRGPSGSSTARRALKGLKGPVEGSTTLAKLRGHGTAGRASETAPPPNPSRVTASKRANGASRAGRSKPIKVFIEVGGDVHVLRVSLNPIESVEDLYDAVMAACVESGAPELREIDFKVRRRESILNPRARSSGALTPHCISSTFTFLLTCTLHLLPHPLWRTPMCGTPA